MSRSGYTDDIDDNWRHIMWRGAVNSAIRGSRGQAFLRELIAALDAMPEKRLASESLVTADGEFCTLGVVGAARGMDMSTLDPEDWHQVAKAFGLAQAMVREIVFENDEMIDEWDWQDVEICGPMRPHYPDWGRHTRSVRVPVQGVAERRWQWMRNWAERQLKEAQ